MGLAFTPHSALTLSAGAAGVPALPPSRRHALHFTLSPRLRHACSRRCPQLNSLGRTSRRAMAISRPCAGAVPSSSPAARSQRCLHPTRHRQERRLRGRLCPMAAASTPSSWPLSPSASPKSTCQGPPGESRTVSSSLA